MSHCLKSHAKMSSCIPVHISLCFFFIFLFVMDFSIALRSCDHRSPEGQMRCFSFSFVYSFFSNDPFSKSLSFSCVEKKYIYIYFLS